jgi:hypothetical protein
MQCFVSEEQKHFSGRNPFISTMLTSHATTVLKEKNKHSIASASVGNRVNERI